MRAIFKKLELRAAPEDHRRVLAVLRYLKAETNGETDGAVGSSANGPGRPDDPGAVGSREGKPPRVSPS